MGRKLKEISQAQWSRIGAMALDGCQNGTIAALMDWEHEFIIQRKDILRFLLKKRAERKRKKRKEQDKHAKTQVSMSIFQGKNELGQADKVDQTHSGPDGTPIPVQIVNFSKVKGESDG